MKKVIVVLLCLVGMTAMAQNGEKQHRNAKKDMTPEQMATLKTKKMTLALDLSDAQQKRIQSLNLENAKNRKAKREKRKAERGDNEFKKPTSDERYAMMNERLNRMIAVKAEMKDVLSAEQYATWEKMAHRKTKRNNRKNDKDSGRKRQTRK